MASVEPTSPPAYKPEDVEKNSPPPSYESIFGKVKKAKEENDSNAKFGMAVCKIITGSIGCTICLGVSLGIPIAMIVMGAIYLDDCPAQRYIPIYLIVHGVFGCVSLVISILKSSKKKKEDEDEEEGPASKFITCIDSLLNAFLFAWFIAGNVWIYGLQGDWVSTPSTAHNYCNYHVYYFAFWVITLWYIFLGVCCLGCIIGLICMIACLFKKD